MGEDIVNPKRYTHTTLECWDFWIYAGLNSLIASAVKYVWRYKYKNGVADLDKALVFLEKAINEKDTVYYSNKEAYLYDNDVNNGLSATQILFMKGATITTRHSTYLTGIDIMKYAIAKLIEEYYQNND